MPRKTIKLNKDKFKFKCKEVSFIGHTLTKNGLKIDPAKVEAITKMEKPQDVSGVQRFIGIIKFLAKFLPGLSEVCEPLRSFDPQRRIMGMGRNSRQGIPRHAKSNMGGASCEVF